LEEVAIGIGYEEIPEHLPQEAHFGEGLKSRTLESKCRETMLGVGFQEVVTLTLTSTKMLHENTGRESEYEAEVSNPVTEDYHMLRSSILPSLLELLSSNRHRELPQKVFEVGQVIREHSNRMSLAWIELESKGTFSKARTTAESIAHRLGISGETAEGKDPAFIPGRCAQIKTKDITLTYGEIHPSALEKFELGYPAIGGEIHW
jgi:phenylalanyl-tRNA synthetase beta chain